MFITESEIKDPLLVGLPVPPLRLIHPTDF